MGWKILKRVIWPWPRPFQGIFFIGRVGLAMVNQCTKFEVSRFTRCEAMNDGAKMQKMEWFWMVRGHSKSWAMPPFDTVHMTSYSTLTETMRLSFTVFEILPVICRKLPILTHPTCIWPAPLQGVIAVEFCGDLWHQITTFPGLSCGVVCVILRLAVLVEHRLVTDRHRQTQASTAHA